MKKQGIWINEKEFVRFSENRKTLTEELATRKRALDFYSLGMYLPNPDPVLKRQGKDIAIYKELLSDAHVGACVVSRKAGVKSLQWEIDRGKSKSRQARLIAEIFKSLDLNLIISEILDAPLYGYRPIEILWERTGNYILPKAVIGKPPEWFVFDDENRLRLKTRNNLNGEELPERKFLLARHNPSYENPYGFPLLSRCFWPMVFKKGGLKFWVIFTEKYGMPFIIGKHPRGTDKADINNMADMLEQMVQDAIAVIPDDSSVEIQEAGGKGASAKIYDQLLHFCNSETSKAILGQTLTTEIGEKGSYAASQTHMEVRKDIIDDDKALVEQEMNRLIRWIFELNFSSGQQPEFILYEEEDVDKDLAERDEKLTVSMERSGLKLTQKYYQKGYGLENEDIEVAPHSISSPRRGEGEFSELSPHPFPDQQAIDDLAGSLTREELQAQMEDHLKPVIKMIEDSTSYEEIMESLAGTYPDMDVKDFEDMLARAIFISETWGRLG